MNDRLNRLRERIKTFLERVLNKKDANLNSLKRRNEEEYRKTRNNMKTY